MKPANTPHPGSLIAEHAQEQCMTQRDLAARLGVTPKHVSFVVRGKSPISAQLALRLEQAFGRPAIYWLQLQALYDLQRVRTKIAARGLLRGNRTARPARKGYRDRVRGA